MKHVNSFKSLILIFLLVFTACTKKADNKAKIGVVEKQDVVQRTSLNGTLRGLRQAQVQPGYAGYVGKVYVKVGQKVKEGDELVRVTQTFNQPLSEVFPIRAPFAGTVTQILAREGEYLTSGATGSAQNAILFIDDLREMWVNATVPEVDVAKVSIGLEAVIRANALPGRTYKGIVKILSMSPRQAVDRWDRGRVEYPLEIRVSNPDEFLRPGMTVVADVISAKAEGVLAIRHEYVHKDAKGFYLVAEDGEEHRLETGLSNETLVEIRSGAPAGLRVQMVDFSKL